MNLQTQIPLVKAENPIDYTSQLLLLGSCFSENMGKKLDYFKFRSMLNPFGILFHPLAIENLIERAIQQRRYTEEAAFFENERWHCFDAHSDLSDTSKEIVLEKLNQGLQQTFDQLGKATHIIITLGTAWVYRHQKTNQVVANCHKVPQKEFSKQLLSTADIAKSLESIIQRIQSINKNVQYVFTVSPIRHLKDGFIENQRSKSQLITAIHQTINTSDFGPRISYFPSYEIMMDELRDYRFYAEDMIHPNQLAIDYIWERFKEVWISNGTHETMNQVDEIQKGLAHRPFHPDSEQHQKFLKTLREKIAYLQREYVFMKFNL